MKGASLSTKEPKKGKPYLFGGETDFYLRRGGGKRGEKASLIDREEVLGDSYTTNILHMKLSEATKEMEEK